MNNIYHNTVREMKAARDTFPHFSLPSPPQLFYICVNSAECFHRFARDANIPIHAMRERVTLQYGNTCLLYHRAAVVGFSCKRRIWRLMRSDRLAGAIGVATIGGAFVCSVLAFFQIYNTPLHQLGYPIVLWDWIGGGTLHTAWAYQIDALSMLMGLIITGVGLLIHVYSIGYMHGDRRFGAFLRT